MYSESGYGTVEGEHFGGHELFAFLKRLFKLSRGYVYGVGRVESEGGNVLDDSLNLAFSNDKFVFGNM